VLHLLDLTASLVAGSCARQTCWSNQALLGFKLFVGLDDILCPNIEHSILPIIDQHGLVPGGQADKIGTGDVTQSFFFSPKQPTSSGWIWGAGPAILVPTGSDELLSSEQWGVGPTVVLLKQHDGWTRGILANHIWSVENSPPDDKDKVNATFLQPFFSTTTHTYTTFGINTESTYDWQTREWSVPINLFVTQLFKVGHQPMTLQAGPRYWADSPKDSAEGWDSGWHLHCCFPSECQVPTDHLSVWFWPVVVPGGCSLLAVLFGLTLVSSSIRQACKIGVDDGAGRRRVM
jgi:hypothetical protein